MSESLLDKIDVNAITIRLNIYDDSGIVKYHLKASKLKTVGNGFGTPEEIASAEIREERQNITDEIDDKAIKLLFDLVINKIRKA